MKEKQFVSVKREGFSGEEEELYVNLKYILWFSKSEKMIALSDGRHVRLADESAEKLESILQSI